MYFPCFLNRKRIKMPKSTQNLQPKSYVVKCAKIEKKKNPFYHEYQPNMESDMLYLIQPSLCISITLHTQGCHRPRCVINHLTDQKTHTAAPALLCLWLHCCTPGYI